MKKVMALLAVCLMAAPTMAGEVSNETLSSLGLGGMEVISDADGMQVRGLSASASAMGTSLVFGQLFDPATGGFVVGSDASASFATAENAGLQILTSATSLQNSAISLNLSINTLTSAYLGNIMGAAGGNSAASGQ